VSYMLSLTGEPRSPSSSIVEGAAAACVRKLRTGENCPVS
jgi:hypothetical protein